jgi:hypothetical protein
VCGADAELIVPRSDLAASNTVRCSLSSVTSALPFSGVNHPVCIGARFDNAINPLGPSSNFHTGHMTEVYYVLVSGFATDASEKRKTGSESISL